MVGSWDHLTVSRDGAEAYRAIVAPVVEALAAGGRYVLLLGEPPTDPVRGEEPTRRQVNRVYRGLAADLPRVDYLSTDTVIGDDQGRWQQGEAGELWRKPDGRHLCPPGAEQFGAAVLGRLSATWRLPPAGPWEDGAWRALDRYDNPDGGCDG
jgi:hypothetical protein